MADDLLQAAHAALKAGDLRRSDTLYQQALAQSPQRWEACYGLGLVALLTGRYDAAEARISEALRSKQDDPAMHANHGAALRALRRYMEAETALRRALELRPAYAVALHTLGDLLLESGRMDEAERSLQQARALAPERIEIWLSLGALQWARGDLDGAERWYRDAGARQPDAALAHLGLGNVLALKGDVETALRFLEHAARLAPDNPQVNGSLATMLLGRGEVARGFRLLDGAPRKTDAAPYFTRLRAGQPTQVTGLLPYQARGKRILVVRDQGLGDELFYLRFAPVLAAAGADVTVLPWPALRGVLAGAEGLRVAETDPAADYDHVFVASDLPLVTGLSSLQEVPPPLPLTPDPVRVGDLRERISAQGPAPYLGVTWRAGTATAQGTPRHLHKEIGVELLGRACAGWPGTLVVLQRNTHAGELETLVRASARPVANCSDLNEDLAGMLAVISVLDDYAGVSNTNMHLRAGVRGRAQVLAPHPPEWRWLWTGGCSPWFPAFHVHRQSADGDWNAALRQLAAALAIRI